MDKEKKTVRLVFETTPEVRKKLRQIQANLDLRSMKDAMEHLIVNAPTAPTSEQSTTYQHDRASKASRVNE